MLRFMRASVSNPFSRGPLVAWHIGCACVCAAVSGQAFGEAYTPPPFGHYQPILDRMPFGAPPADFNAAAVDPSTLKNEAQVIAEQQTLAKKINMSAVNVTPDGQTAIGFTDLSQNPPVNYYLLVGTVAGGWTVVSADYDDETATIEKDGVTITLKLGKGLVDPAALPAKSAVARPLFPAAGKADAAASGTPHVLPRRPTSNIPLPSVRGFVHQAVPEAVTTPGEGSNDTRSYAERQRDRVVQQTQDQLAAEAKQRAQLEKLARDAASNEIKRREEEAAQAAPAAPAEDPQAQPGQVQ